MDVARFKMECRSGVSACHIQWLGLRAFQTVLRRKQSRYRAVLSELEAELAAPAFRHLPVQLGSVVDPLHSTVFDEILY